MGVKVLLLYDYPESIIKKYWVRLKILIKEGLLRREWKVFKKNHSVGGSIVIPESLKSGLGELKEELDLDISINNYNIENYNVVVVMKNISALNWAIDLKNSGKIKKLIAGPFISTFPNENKGILYSPAIDGLIFLSEWHRQLFLSNYNKKPPTNFIWFAGVDSNFWQPNSSLRSNLSNSKKFNDEIKRPNILIYLKTEAPGIFPEITKILNNFGLSYSLLEYGNYTVQEYKENLKSCDFAVFISQSETQGIALMEAWSMDVPTLVWNPGTMKYFGKIYDGASSCPYLNDSCGAAFCSLEEFKLILNLLRTEKKLFSPRAEVLNHFTLKKSAERFIKIVEEMEGRTDHENINNYSHL